MIQAKWLLYRRDTHPTSRIYGICREVEGDVKGRAMFRAFKGSLSSWLSSVGETRFVSGSGRDDRLVARARSR